MKPALYLSKTLALFLSIILSMPNLAFALREESPPQAKETLSGLEEALKSGPDATVREISRAIKGFVQNPSAPTAGLEEEFGPGKGIPASNKKEVVDQAAGEIQEEFGLNAKSLDSVRRFLQGSLSLKKTAASFVAENLAEINQPDEARDILIALWLGVKHELPDLRQRKAIRIYLSEDPSLGIRENLAGLLSNKAITTVAGVQQILDEADRLANRVPVPLEQRAVWVIKLHLLQTLVGRLYRAAKGGAQPANLIELLEKQENQALLQEIGITVPDLFFAVLNERGSAEQFAQRVLQESLAQGHLSMALYAISTLRKTMWEHEELDLDRAMLKFSEVIMDGMSVSGQIISSKFTESDLREMLARMVQILPPPPAAGLEETVTDYRNSLEEMDVLTLVAKAKQAVGDSQNESVLRGILPDPTIVDWAKKNIQSAQAHSLNSLLLMRQPLLDFLVMVWMARHPEMKGSSPQPLKESPPAAGLEEAKQAIQKFKLMAVISPDPADPESAIRIGRIVAARGIIPEVTFRGDKNITLDAIRKLSAELRGTGMPVAAGTVLTSGQAREAVEGGAMINVSPGFIPDVVRTTKELHAVSIPAVGDSKEALEVLPFDPDYLKVFPVVGGERFEDSVKAPLPAELKKSFAQRVGLLRSSDPGWSSAEPATFTRIYNHLMTDGTSRKDFAIPDIQDWELLREIAAVAPGVGLIPTGHGSVDYIPRLLSPGHTVVATGMSVGGTDVQAAEKADRMAAALKTITPDKTSPAAGLEELEHHVWGWVELIRQRVAVSTVETVHVMINGKLTGSFTVRDDSGQVVMDQVEDKLFHALLHAARVSSDKNIYLTYSEKNLQIDAYGIPLWRKRLSTGLEEGKKPPGPPEFSRYDDFVARHNEIMKFAETAAFGKHRVGSGKEAQEEPNRYFGEAIWATWTAIQVALSQVQTFFSHRGDIQILLNNDLENLARYYQAHYEERSGEVEVLPGAQAAQRIYSLGEAAAQVRWFDLFGSSLSWETVQRLFEQNLVASTIQFSSGQENRGIVLEKPADLMGKVRRKERLPSPTQLGENLYHIGARVFLGKGGKAFPHVQKGRLKAEQVLAREESLARHGGLPQSGTGLKEELLYPVTDGDPWLNHLRFVRHRLATLLRQGKYPYDQEMPQRPLVRPLLMTHTVAKDLLAKARLITAEHPFATGGDIETMIEEVFYFLRKYPDSPESALQILTRIDRNEDPTGKFAQAIALVVKQVQDGVTDRAQIRSKVLESFQVAGLEEVSISDFVGNGKYAAGVPESQRDLAQTLLNNGAGTIAAGVVGDTFQLVTDSDLEPIANESLQKFPVEGIQLSVLGGLRTEKNFQGQGLIAPSSVEGSFTRPGISMRILDPVFKQQMQALTPLAWVALNLDHNLTVDKVLNLKLFLLTSIDEQGRTIVAIFA